MNKNYLSIFIPTVILLSFILIFFSVKILYRDPLLLVKNWKENLDNKVRHYRHPKISINKKKLKKDRYKGLKKLDASGSSQVFYDQLLKLKEDFPGKNIVVVDLRQESHGFINGIPVSWYSRHNTANTDKKLDQIEHDELNKLSKIMKEKNAKIYTLVKPQPDKPHQGKDPIKLLANECMTEKDVCTAAGVGYARFPVQDFHAPDDEQVNRFVEFVKNLPSNSWLHFHCCAGRGRTTTFMAMYDMMKNANRVSLDDIVKRHKKMGGIDLFTDYTKYDWRYWKYLAALERMNLIRKFYEYAKEQKQHNFTTSWIDWIKKEREKNMDDE